MDKIIDFNKYTLGLAAALLLFVPKEFMPRDTDIGFWFVLGIVGVCFLCCVMGILVYSTATTALSSGKTVAPTSLNIFGQIHLWTLLASFIGAAVLYVDKYLWDVSDAQSECPVMMGANGQLLLTPACAALLKEGS